MLRLMNAETWGFLLSRQPLGVGPQVSVLIRVQKGDGGQRQSGDSDQMRGEPVAGSGRRPAGASLL